MSDNCHPKVATTLVDALESYILSTTLDSNIFRFGTYETHPRSNQVNVKALTEIDSFITPLLTSQPDGKLKKPQLAIALREAIARQPQRKIQTNKPVDDLIRYVVAQAFLKL